MDFQLRDVLAYHVGSKDTADASAERGRQWKLFRRVCGDVREVVGQDTPGLARAGEGEVLELVPFGWGEGDGGDVLLVPINPAALPLYQRNGYFLHKESRLG